MLNLDLWKTCKAVLRVSKMVEGWGKISEKISAKELS